MSFAFHRVSEMGFGTVLLNFWNREIWRNDQRAMRLMAALVCTLFSFLIGYLYAGTPFITGWQLWAWFGCVMGVVAALLPPSRPPLLEFGGMRWLFALVLVALGLRLILIEQIPGGLHVDEAGVAEFSLRHVFPVSEPTTLNPFHTGAASQPALYHYWIRLFLALVGNSITALRLSSVLAGSLAVIATYAAVAVLQDRPTAIIAALLMATYHYHIHWSRLGLNNVWDTLWVPAILAAYAWGWRRQWSGGAVLAGLGVGLSQYFYAGSRLGLVLLAFLMWQLWREERDRRKVLVYVSKVALTAVCVAIPLALFAWKEPVIFFERARMVFAWQREVIILDSGGQYDLWGYAWRQLGRSMGAFTFVPDVTGFYGPGVPLTIGAAGPLLIIGFLWSLRQRIWIPVLWILLTIFLGGFLLTGAPSSSHYVVSIPAICWLVALPISWLYQNGRGWFALALLLSVMVTDIVFYFGVYVPGEPRDLINPFPVWPPEAH